MSNIAGDPAFEPDTLPTEEERPDWLPPKFKTVEALVESYAAAERRITELGQANSDLNAALAASQPQYEYEPQYAEAPQQYDQAAELARMRMLTEQAHGVYQQPRQQLSPELHAKLQEIVTQHNTADLTVQAERMVEGHIHGWQSIRPQVTSLLSSSPDCSKALEQAAQTGLVT
jgi:hypothetical protein